MQESLDAMNAALRVLTAVNEKRQPEAKDVEVLRSLAGPQREGVGMDELACDAVANALKRRAEARGRAFRAGTL